MAKRTILTAPDPRLKQSGKDVVKVDGEIRTLIEDMLETMYAADGVGLAAPQIGVSLNVVVIDVAQKENKNEPQAFLNPKIVWASDETAKFEEGCLSVPDIWEEVTRATAIRVEYMDRDGNQQTLEADGFLADCLQHEIDHLNGTLFIDHLSRLKRSMALRKLEKKKKELA
ncbi:peptide deformylase [Rhizomicrobium electricum]|uniref:Peptide deformylase n=1 Tax=Rhizomicrobium electricum TaxID=480070 RepID=A0ABP3QAJ2_9PROT|nr:peptide deformylase [Rhizomicrobium electricum]NIJ49454.1 peptide deformylase [Rhizomicrobium electricum]